MDAMRPDEIVEEMDRQRRKDLRDYIFVVIMLVVMPVVFCGMILLDIVS